MATRSGDGATKIENLWSEVMHGGFCGEWMYVEFNLILSKS